MPRTIGRQRFQTQQKRFEDLNASSRRRVLAGWEKGNLTYKLHSGQVAVKKALKGMKKDQGRYFLLDCARRWGKSFFGLCMCIEACIQMDGARVPYVAPELKMVKGILHPLMRQIVLDAPPGTAPRLLKSENTWVFPNGSEIIMVGSDKNPDSARGTHLDFGVVDEGAFATDLDYVMTSVLIPQMQGREWARLLLMSTPPKNLAHPWTRFRKKAIERKVHFSATIEDNPLRTPEEIEEFNDELGGRDSIACRRENYAEYVADTSTLIVPEFQQHRRTIVDEEAVDARPDFFDAYVSMDPGAVDLKAVLFGYYDFLNTRICIEDELVIERATTADFAELLRQKEQELWGTKAPTLRVTDIDVQHMHDLLIDHKIYFQPTPRKDKDAALHRMRVWMQIGRIKIHPRCKVLISHLEVGMWNDNKTSFMRLPGFGHFDCIDALCYFVRNVDELKNPFPPEYAFLDPTKTFISHPGAERRAKSQRAVFRAFGGSKGKRGPRWK